MIEGWDRALSTMNVGEKALIQIDDADKYGYGAVGVAPVVPPNARLTIEVEILESEEQKNMGVAGVVGAGAIATGLTGSGDLGALDPNKPVSSFVRFRIPVPLCSVGFWLPFWWLKMICKAMYLIFILFILLCTSSFNHDREHPRRLQQHTR